MNDAQQPAFVLHRRPYRETSLLVELFARDAGRVGVVARGGRRRGVVPLEPFVEFEARWRGRGDLGRLLGAEPAAPPRALHGDALYSGFYVNELLLRLLRRHDPHPALYADYLTTLDALVTAGETVEPVLRLFERQLLEACGYGLQLAEDADDGTPLRPDGLYRYQPEHGPVAARDGARGGLLVHGRALLALAGGRPEDRRDLRELKRLLRALLEPHLGPRPLASRGLFRVQARRPDPLRGR
jgi:DNA repair protein RecO (recombination protein O)